MTLQRIIELTCIIITCSWLLIGHALETESRLSKVEAYQASVRESNQQLTEAVQKLTASVNKLQGHLNYSE